MPRTKSTSAQSAPAKKKSVPEKSVEASLWESANKLRGSVEPTEYKHVVLSLIFLKFASDKFEEQREKLIAAGRQKYVEMPEFYNKDNVFYLEETSRWSFIIEHARQSDIALLIDTALANIEKKNKALRGALPDNYFSRLQLDTAKLAALISDIDGIDPNNLPDGWRMGTVGEFCAKMTSGGTPSRTNNDYWNSKDYPWLKTGEVQNNVIFETEEYISEAGLKNSSAKLTPTGSVVMAMYGATAAQVGYLQCETTTNQACCNMICKSEIDAAFLYFHFLVNQEEIKRLATGGAQENLSQDVISAQPILIIEDDSVKQPFSAIMRKFVCCFKEIKILTQMQTLLLSKMGA